MSLNVLFRVELISRFVIFLKQKNLTTVLDNVFHEHRMKILGCRDEAFVELIISESNRSTIGLV